MIRFARRLSRPWKWLDPDFAIAGYFNFSWSIITDDGSFINWIDTKNMTDPMKQLSKYGFTEVEENTSVWTCTPGSVAEIPEYFAQGILVHNCTADALAWHASIRFGDQHQKYSANRKSINVMNVAYHDVHAQSFAARRKAYLQGMLKKQREESNW